MSDGFDAYAQAVRMTADDLARARYAEAEAFVLAKNATSRPITDGQAMRQAVIDTGAELDRAEAEYVIAKYALVAFAEGRI